MSFYRDFSLIYIISNCLFLVGCDNDANRDYELTCSDEYSIKNQDGLIADELLKEYIVGNKKSDLGELIKVSVEGNVISYDGYISYSGLLRFKRLLSSNPHIRLVKIDSLGGVTSLGLCFGEIVFNHKLDIEVENTIYSSAANYIFVAGKNKYIGKNSLIGFHGGEASEEFYDIEKNENVTNKDISDKLENDWVKEWERKFYKKLGVNIMLITAGQDKKYFDLNEVGWTYTLEAFKYLGVDGIKLKDGHWDINANYNESQRLFIIDKIDLITSADMPAQ